MQRYQLCNHNWIQISSLRVNKIKNKYRWTPTRDAKSLSSIRSHTCDKIQKTPARHGMMPAGPSHCWPCFNRMLWFISCFGHFCLISGNYSFFLWIESDICKLHLIQCIFFYLYNRHALNIYGNKFCPCKGHQ